MLLFYPIVILNKTLFEYEKIINLPFDEAEYMN